MPATLVNRVASTIRPDVDHPYMTGAWTPTHEEWDATDMPVIGEIPKDLDGIYLRNTENPVHHPIGLYHPFDGDGMIHAVGFQDGKASYRNRFVRTKGFAAEAEAREALWAGLAEHPSKSKRPGWGAQGGLKDSSSTDVVVHAGRILSTFYQCGEGYRLDPETLADLGVEGWVPPDGISAHPKVDEASGELLFFNYSKTPPYMHYGVVGPDNRLKHYVPIPLPGPRLPHDMAFTRNWSILNDLPLFWQEDLLPRGIHAARFHPDMPSRFALIPRYGGPEDIRWFEARPCYVLHWLNAYEEGDEVVLDGYFQEDPAPPPLEGFGRLGQMMAYLDEHSMKPKLWRWRFNLKTGETKEGPLDDRILEFGTFNQGIAGAKGRYAYSTTAKPGWFLFTGIVKHDLESGRSWSLPFGEGRYGSEAPFAPRVGATAEDDGYLVSFVTDMVENRSECVVVDAADIGAGPVCRIILPHRISSGTHACWADRRAPTS
ncbi:MAG: carotenoid oxygenase family protein [Phenylobacterium sp.]|uniref:carotenoid oxygenase family protein n=1 Tax=Phenylobacterium sp. TaxID=1871053 RepID=UPI001A4AE19C|nr:carotenoid oxygenase family protein [Phenylobacterium sp.]MBL8554342.1 carotenoid oxygenase family protein [Phenylobacterium sp.]